MKKVTVLNSLLIVMITIALAFGMTSCPSDSGKKSGDPLPSGTSFSM